MNVQFKVLTFESKLMCQKTISNPKLLNETFSTSKNNKSSQERANRYKEMMRTKLSLITNS